MSKPSSIAALIGAAVLGAVVAIAVVPRVAPPGLLPGIGAVEEPATPAAESGAPSGEVEEQDLAAPAGEDAAPAGDDAAAAEAEKGEVIAVVNGQNLHQSDLYAFIQQLPPQLQSQVQMLLPQILDQLVNNQLTLDAGRAAGLAGDAEVQRRVTDIEDLIIGQIYLQRAIDERVTAEQLEAAYQKFLEENPPQRQLTARHILLETEEAAKEVIVALDGGADFAELARERSTGPSKTNGGELPPFTAGEMVPEFSDAAFAMEVGGHSKAPVKTQFGYHVIKIEGSAMTEPPAKEEMEQQLRGELEQQAASAVYEDLREGAQIEILLGKPTAEEAPAGGEAAPAEEAPSEPAPAAEEPAPDAN